MKKLNLTLFALMLSLCSIGQVTLSGTVKEEPNQIVPYAIVEVLNQGDSVLLAGLVTDSLGYFALEGAPPGNYVIRISVPGYKDWYSGPLEVKNADIVIEPINMIWDVMEIEGVGVVAFRPMIAFRDGMMVVDVENNPLNAGNTVLDVLRNIPGVSVDGAGTILVNGKSGVGIMFDDRLQQLPSSQISALLSSTPAESIKSIELIKNPPAKYDAQGISGLINIRSKQRSASGFNGSVGTTNSLGRKYRSVNNLLLNVRKDRLSLFTNLAYSYNDLWTSSEFDRTLFDTLTINSLGIGANRKSSLNFNGGLEFDLTPMSTIGINVNGDVSRTNILNTSETTVSDSNGFGYDYFRNNTSGKESYNFVTTGLFFKGFLDSLGSSIGYSGDVSFFKYQLPQSNTNSFFLTDGTESSPSSGYLNDINLDFLVITNKLDYSKVFSPKWTLELGLKNSIVDNANDLQLRSSSGGSAWELDSTLTNYFTYNEMINAGYVSGRYTLQKFVFNAGVRAEHTTFEGKNRTTGSDVNRSYFNLFPSFSVDYQPNDKNMMQLSYSYRIDRPAFEQMVPGRIFSNQLSYAVGNPELLPQYSHNVNFEHYFKNLIGNSLNYTHIDNSIFGFNYTEENSQINIDTTMNFASRDMLAYTFMLQKQFGKVYSVQFSAMGIFSAFNGTVNNSTVSTAAVASSLNLANDFFLPKGYRLQLNMRFQTPFKEGIQFSSPIGAVSFAIRKKFFDNKLSTVLGISDIFFTDYGTVSVDLPQQVSVSTQQRDSRRVTVSIVYNFGSGQFDKKVINDEGGTDRIGRKK